jgi:hypothetical protein
MACRLWVFHSFFSALQYKDNDRDDCDEYPIKHNLIFRRELLNRVIGCGFRNHFFFRLGGGIFLRQRHQIQLISFFVVVVMQ